MEVLDLCLPNWVWITRGLRTYSGWVAKHFWKEPKKPLPAPWLDLQKRIVQGGGEPACGPRSSLYPPLKMPHFPVFSGNWYAVNHA